MKFAWIDVRHRVEQTEAVVEEAIHNGVEGIVSDDPALLQTLPPSIRKVVIIRPELSQHHVEDLLSVADLVLVDHSIASPTAPAATDAQTVVYLNVVDEKTLDIACRLATHVDWLAVDFPPDPSKIHWRSCSRSRTKPTANW